MNLDDAIKKTLPCCDCGSTTNGRYGTARWGPCRECSKRRSMEYRQRNVEKNRAASRKYKKENPHVVAAWRAKNKTKLQEQQRSYKYAKYGITKDKYDEMVVAQRGVCAICKSHPSITSPKRPFLFVDHCHGGGGVRALLCQGCNVALGYIREDHRIAASMAEYIQQWAGLKNVN